PLGEGRARHQEHERRRDNEGHGRDGGAHGLSLLQCRGGLGDRRSSARLRVVVGADQARPALAVGTAIITCMKRPSRSTETIPLACSTWVSPSVERLVIRSTSCSAAMSAAVGAAASSFPVGSTCRGFCFL